MAQDQPSAKLNNGAHIPMIGYGTWQSQDAELEAGLEAALQAGYRHIDTATAYGNEHVIGAVLERWIYSGKATREDFFITTKLPTFGSRASSVQKYITQSLHKLKLDYLDLYLLHGPIAVPEEYQQVFPMGPDGSVILEPIDLIAVWKAMEEQVDKGRTKAIGLSNCNENQIGRILGACRIRPANLQIEIHMYFQQEPLVDFCKQRNISVTAYSPLGTRGSSRGLPDLFDLIEVKKIAHTHIKTPAQILLRYTLQRDIIIIPKSTTPARISQNIQILDFQLNPKEMETLKGLDKGPIARILDFGRMKGMKSYPEFPF